MVCLYVGNICIASIQISEKATIKITNTESALVDTLGFIDGGMIIQSSSKKTNIDINNNMSSVIDLIDIGGSSSGVEVKL